VKILGITLVIAWTLVMLALFVGCAGSPTGPDLVGPTLDVFEYWPDAEYRINYWLNWHPDCSREDVQPMINGVFDEPVKTCAYNPSDRTISVRPEFIDGCMAHELGHAALHQAGNDCWRDFEHDLEDAPR
jgi:hypothetical protein